MNKFCKRIILGQILILLLSYNVFAEDEREIIGRVLNYKPFSEQEINVSTIHRRFLERFFDEVRYDSCYANKVEENKYVIAEIFYVAKLKEDALKGESYVTRKTLRETEDFIIFLWQYNKDSEDIRPKNFFSRAALNLSLQRQK